MLRHSLRPRSYPSRLLPLRRLQSTSASTSTLSQDPHVAQWKRHRPTNTAEVHQKYQTAVSVGRIRKHMGSTNWLQVVDRTRLYGDDVEIRSFEGVKDHPISISVSEERKRRVERVLEREKRRHGNGGADGEGSSLQSETVNAESQGERPTSLPEGSRPSFQEKRKAGFSTAPRKFHRDNRGRVGRLDFPSGITRPVQRPDADTPPPRPKQSSLPMGLMGLRNESSGPSNGRRNYSTQSSADRVKDEEVEPKKKRGRPSKVAPPPTQTNVAPAPVEATSTANATLAAEPLSGGEATPPIVEANTPTPPSMESVTVGDAVPDLPADALRVDKTILSPVDVPTSTPMDPVTVGTSPVSDPSADSSGAPTSIGSAEAQSPTSHPSASSASQKMATPVDNVSSEGSGTRKEDEFISDTATESSQRIFENSPSSGPFPFSSNINDALFGLPPGTIPQDLLKEINTPLDLKDLIQNENTYLDDFLKQTQEFAAKSDDSELVKAVETSAKLIDELKQWGGMGKLLERMDKNHSNLQETALAWVNLQKQEEKFAKQRAGKGLAPGPFREISEIIRQPLTEDSFKKIEALLDPEELDTIKTLFRNGVHPSDIPNALQERLFQSTRVSTPEEEDKQIEEVHGLLKRARTIPFVEDPRMFYARQPKPSDFAFGSHVNPSAVPVKPSKSVTPADSSKSKPVSNNYTDYLFPVHQIIPKGPSQSSEVSSSHTGLDFTNDPLKTAEQALGLNASMTLEQKEKLFAEIRDFITQHTPKPKSTRKT
ncbi:hypothetical protein BT69DRAFT_1351160 [Atractiella rhizophila]|nr:hypothetical protein BT69DRAFT_1351160 [Atractiella rhizophila]